MFKLFEIFRLRRQQQKQMDEVIQKIGNRNLNTEEMHLVLDFLNAIRRDEDATGKVEEICKCLDKKK